MTISFKKTCLIYHLVILISIVVRNRLKSYIYIAVYLSASIYHKSTFCISYLRFIILLQHSLEIKLQNSIPHLLFIFLFKIYTHKMCTSRLQILGTNLTFSIFIPLLNSLVFTNVRRDQAHWPIIKEAQSFEMPPTGHTNFTIKDYTTRSTKARHI